LTFEEVAKSPQFNKLSVQQRKFIEELCTNGWDRIDAARVAYPNCSTEASLAAAANKVMRNEQVKAVIALIDPTKVRMTREEALEIAAKHVRAAEKPADAFKGLELIAEWEGWAHAPTTAPTESGETDIYEQAEKLARSE
jgi:isopropylmalate/homocitrate/citramalate synthase